MKTVKRCIKWLINWFVQWSGRMLLEEKISTVCGGIIGIIVGIITFVYVDKVPANQVDYEPLKEQVVAIQKNPEILFNTDCNINIKDQEITVELNNDECKVTAKYDKNFKLLSISKEDDYVYWPFI